MLILVKEMYEFLLEVLFALLIVKMHKKLLQSTSNR